MVEWDYWAVGSGSLMGGLRSWLVVCGWISEGWCRTFALDGWFGHWLWGFGVWDRGTWVLETEQERSD